MPIPSEAVAVTPVVEIVGAQGWWALYQQRSVMFELGQIVATKAALNAFDNCGDSPVTYIRRHQTGDWGELGADDKRANEVAIKQGLRILSKYKIKSGESIYVITEWDRSYTTVMMREDY